MCVCACVQVWVCVCGCIDRDLLVEAVHTASCRTSSRESILRCSPTGTPPSVASCFENRCFPCKKWWFHGISPVKMVISWGFMGVIPFLGAKLKIDVHRDRLHSHAEDPTITVLLRKASHGLAGTAHGASKSMERNASKSASHWTVWNYPQISTLEPSYAQLILDIYWIYPQINHILDNHSLTIY